eukprot:gene17067-23164_t
MPLVALALVLFALGPLSPLPEFQAAPLKEGSAREVNIAAWHQAADASPVGACKDDSSLTLSRCARIHAPISMRVPLESGSFRSLRRRLLMAPPEPARSSNHQTACGVGSLKRLPSV